MSEPIYMEADKVTFVNGDTLLIRPGWIVNPLGSVMAVETFVDVGELRDGMLVLANVAAIVPCRLEWTTFFDYPGNTTPRHEWRLCDVSMPPPEGCE